MAYKRYLVPYSNSFYGNPNRSISTITTTGGIACSRTSGKTPCFVQASASAITASGTSKPYEDLDYSWNFGDSGSTETFTNPGVGGGTVNSNLGQKGPEAVHCYRSAGTFVITLTIRGHGNSALVLATVTQEIIVSAFSASGGEYWADSTHGGTNAGTEANPFNTVTDINSAISSGTNKQVHVAKGSAFDGSVALNIGVTSGFRMDAYGTGDIPAFNVSSGISNVNALRLINSTAKDDAVVSGIRLSTSDTSAANAVVSIGANNDGANTVTNVYLDSCEVHVGADNNQINGVSISSTAKLTSKFGLWKCIVTGPASMTNRSIGYFCSGMDWSFVVGGSVEGATSAGGATLDHHIYPSIKEHALFRWIEFKDGENRNYCINLNHNAVDDEIFEYGQYYLIADNHMKGVQRGHDGSNGDNDPAQTLLKNFVCERNKLSGLSGDGIILFYSTETYTHRDNEAWDCTGGRYLIPNPSAGQGAVLQLSVYRNKVHRDATVSGGDIIALSSSAFVQLHQITDNIIADLRDISRMHALAWTQQAGALADRNQYYAPNDGGANGWRDVTTEKTFAEWQAAGFDLNGSVADPGWTDAANGDFS